MEFINQELNTKLTVIEDEGGGLLFDLNEVARNLGYSDANQAIYDFIKRNGDLLPEAATCSIDNKYYVEGVVQLFLLKSSMPRAREYQKWVAFEVLPAVRRVGLNAVKELALLHAINKREVKNLEQALKMAPKEIVDLVLASGPYYRIEGLMVASEIASELGIRLYEFYHRLEAAQILDSQGELLKPELGRHVNKYHNSYTSCGKWYAWSPLVVDLLKAPEVDRPVKKELVQEETSDLYL